MVKFGIITQEQYLRLDERERRYSGAHVAYNLLNVGEQPSAEQIRIFEDVSFTLRTSNGTFRTTFRNRFEDVDEVALQWLRKLYSPGSAFLVQDRAVSHGLTSKEFAERIFEHFPNAVFEASDLLLGLVELSVDGDVYIAERSGTPLQYIKWPFVVPLYHKESRRYPWNRWVAWRARRRFENLNLSAGWSETQSTELQSIPTQQGAGARIRYIPYIHPEAIALTRKNPNFRFCERSVFDASPGACNVLRTMNIFNRDYFSEQQLMEGVSAAFKSLRPGGLWIVGRTLEEKFTNHATFFRRGEKGFEVLERIGSGSEMEALALSGAANR
jgi:hypothetical protein